MKQALITVLLLLGTFALNAQCAPSFTWAQTAPNEITFTNTTTPIVQDSTTFTWFFGDMTTSTDQDPVHIYSGPDTVVVCMWVADSILNCTASYCDTVIVTGTVLCNNMSASVWVMQHAACGACPTGAASGIGYGGTAPYTYSWNTGSTDQAIGQLLPGIYTCTVTDVYGCTASASGVLSTGMQWPCSVDWNNVHTSGDSVLFRADALAGTPYQEFFWTFGDNGTGTDDTMYHEYTYADTFTVCLYMTDSIYSCYDSFCDTIIIDSIPPPVYCSAGLYGYQSQWNEHVVFNLSGGNFSPVYYWSWGDNTYDTLQFPTHVYNTPGTYQICVTVVDTGAPVTCSDSMCLILTIAPGTVPYTVNVSQIPIGVVGSLPENVHLYPNPANDILMIDGPVAASSIYRITDLAGRTVQTGLLMNRTIDIRMLSSGSFFITIMNENGTGDTRIFVKE